jgi:hypothetical protein
VHGIPLLLGDDEAFSSSIARVRRRVEHDQKLTWRRQGDRASDMNRCLCAPLQEASWTTQAYNFLQSNVLACVSIVQFVVQKLGDNVNYILEFLGFLGTFLAALFYFVTASNEMTYKPLTFVRIFVPNGAHREKVYRCDSAYFVVRNRTPLHPVCNLPLCLFVGLFSLYAA